MEKNNYDIGESSVYKKYSEKVSLEIIYFFIDFLKVKNFHNVSTTKSFLNMRFLCDCLFSLF